MKMPPITPYGVPIRDIMSTGDQDLMQSMRNVSHHIMGMVSKAGGEIDKDWKAAHEELEKATK